MRAPTTSKRAGWLALATLLTVSLGTPAHAGQSFTGTYIDIDYDDDGLMYWDTVDSGLVYHDDYGWSWNISGESTWIWNRLNVEYTTTSTQEYAANTYYGTDFSSVSAADLSTSATNWAEHVYSTPELSITRHDVWDNGDSHVSVHFIVENTSSSTVTDVVLLWSFDTEMELEIYGIYGGLHDTIDGDGDGVAEWAQSEGYYSTLTVGLRACDPANADLGHDANWGTAADTTLTDYNGGYDDAALVWRTELSSLDAGEIVEASVVMVIERSSSSISGALGTAVLDCDRCDGDGDGSPSSTCGGDDCDDADATAYPGALRYADDDGDGYGDPLDVIESCLAVTGRVSDASDCDDTDAAIQPGATEVCDGADNDCNGDTDEDDAGLDTSTLTTWYSDADGDGYGVATSSELACLQPSGTSDNTDDCDDTRPGVNPGETEVCDDSDVDENCNGLADDADPDVDPSTQSTWHEDNDGDGYGSAVSFEVTCEEVPGAVENGLDCDDDDSAANPAASEIPDDGIDQDCNGEDASSGGSGSGGDDGGDDGGGDSGGGDSGGGDSGSGDSGSGDSGGGSGSSGGSSSGGSSGGGESAVIGAEDTSDGDKGACSTAGGRGSHWALLSLFGLIWRRRARGPRRSASVVQASLRRRLRPGLRAAVDGS